MENGGVVKSAMENGRRQSRRFSTELVMCSTCSGFVVRMKHTTMDPDEKVVEVVTEAQKMRDLIYAVSRYGPLQDTEPAEATKEQWHLLRKRRLFMMDTKRCPACSRSLSEEPGPLEEDWEDKAAGSKEKKSSREEVSELIFPSLGGKERKKIAAEDGAMVANHRSVNKAKRSRDEGKRSSSGSKKKKKAKEGSGSKKAKRSCETEGSGSKEDAEMEVSESASGNGKTKMVSMRLYKKSIEFFEESSPNQASQLPYLQSHYAMHIC